MNDTVLRISLSTVLGLAFIGCDAGPPLITLRTANASLVEYQDGDGAWQVVAGRDGTYTFPVASERYGVIVGCKAPSFAGLPPEANVTLDYYAVSDGADHFIYGCVPTADPTLVDVGGAIIGTQADERAAIDTGLGLGGMSLGFGASWSSSAHAGAGLLLATRLSKDQLPVSVLTQQVTYKQGATIDLDFTHALPLTTTPVAVDPAASRSIASGYVAPSGRVYVLSQVSPPGAFYTLPDALRGDGLALISTFSTDEDGTLRTVEHAFRTPPSHLDLPAKLVLAHPPTLTTTGAYPKLSTAVPAFPDVLAYQLSYFGSVDGRSVAWTVTYSGAWLADHGQAGASFTSELPDLPALAAYALPSQALQWTVSAVTGPHTLLPGIETPEAELRHDGDTFTVSEQRGAL